MNLDHLLVPVSETAPAGHDCSHTAGFQQLSALAEYLVERTNLEELERQARFEYRGDNAESDLRSAFAFAEDGRRRVETLAGTVKALCGGTTTSLEAVQSAMIGRAETLLAQRGKDLRVVQLLALAWLARDGLPGLAAGIQLFEALLDRYGAALHPLPDEDDPLDTSARDMVATEMVAGTGFRVLLRETKIMDAASAGWFSGRDAEVMEGQLEADRSSGARSPAELRHLAGTLAAKTLGDSAAAAGPEGIELVLGQQLAAVTGCIDGLARIAGAAASGSARGNHVLRLLELIRKHLLLAATPPAAAVTSTTAHAAASVAQGPPPLVAPASHSVGPITSRDEARRIILEVSRFIEGSEPSHPAPLFLKRAERLLRAKDFFAVVRDMAPDSITELERITGYHEEPATETDHRRMQ